MTTAAAVCRRVRVKMRPEGSNAVGCAGSPGGEKADAAGSVIAAEWAPCEVCWATAVAARGPSAEPMSPSEGTAKTGTKAVSAVVKISPRPGRRSTMVTAAVIRATNRPEGAESSSILIRGPCARNHENPKRRKGVHPKPRSRGGAPKPTPRIGEERVRSTQARMRKIPPSSTGVRLLDPLRSCSVAVSG